MGNSGNHLNKYQKTLNECIPVAASIEAEMTATARANATVPFHGEYYVEVTFLTEEGELPVIASLYAEGKARHLGNSTWICEETIINLVIDPEDGSVSFSQTGDMTFTAADGSQLMGYFEGEYYPTEYDENGEVVSVTYGINRIPDSMALEEMLQYEHGLNVDRLISLSALIAFVKLQNANRGYKKRFETEDNSHLENSDKIYNLNKSAPFKNIGRRGNAFSTKKPKRSPFRRLK